MKSKCLSALLVVFLLTIVSGCAFTVNQTPLNYSYSGRLPAESDKASTKTLTLMDIKDARDVTTPKMIMHKINGHGFQTSGGWEAEKPIADIVRDALAEGIKQKGLTLAPKGDISLSGELLGYGGWFKHPTPFHGVFKGRMTVKLQLRDETSKKILWRDTFVGEATIDEGEYIKDGFTMALNDLVTKVVTDQFFLQHLE
jgi:hypothetical protein